MVVEFTDMYVFCEGQIEGFDHSSGLAEQGLYRLLLNSHHSCRITLAEGHPACVTFDELIDPLSMFSVISAFNTIRTACLHAATEPCRNSVCLLSVSVLHQRLWHPNSHVNHYVIKLLFIFQTYEWK